MNMSNENNSKQLSRSEAREQAFMLLFSNSFGDEPIEDIIEDNEDLFEGGICGYAKAVAGAVMDKAEELDAAVSKYLKKGWTVSRISKASRAILRLAIYEIKYVDSVPDSVAVSEAVELAKKYTLNESKFVNGVLGSFIRGRSEEKV